jgi:hypothetical protein
MSLIVKAVGVNKLSYKHTWEKWRMKNISAGNQSRGNVRNFVNCQKNTLAKEPVIGHLIQRCLFCPSASCKELLNYVTEQ